jgi:hypothetical protein
MSKSYYVIENDDIFPSKDFDEMEYDIFLSIATPLELKNDFVSNKTYYEICRQLNKPIRKPKPKFPQSRLFLSG